MKKKIILSVTAICLLLFSLTGCNGGFQYPNVDEYWVSEGTGVPDENGYLSETAEYRVETDKTYFNSGNENNKAPRIVNAAGTYVSTIKWKPGAKDSYTVITSLTVTGKYESPDGSYVSPEFTDTVVSTAVMNTSTKNFFPISSETYVSYTDCYSENDTYTIQSLKYKKTANYNFDDKSATTTLNRMDENGNYTLPLYRSPSNPNSGARKQNASFSGLSNRLVLDNTTIFYALRALSNQYVKENTSFTQQFSVIDIDNQNQKTLGYSYPTATETEPIFTDLSFDVNGANVTRSTVRTNIANTSTDKMGGSISLWYDTAASKLLVKMTQGQFVYTLEKLNGNYIA